MTPSGNTTVTVETEDGTTTKTLPNGPWTTMHDIASQWEAAGWRYSIRTNGHRVTLTRYNGDGTIDQRVTLTDEPAW